jgi:Na+/phosphate symporter
VRLWRNFINALSDITLLNQRSLKKLKEEMFVETLVLFLFIFCVLCLAVVTWFTLKKGERQTESMIALTKSFLTIGSDLRVIVTMLEEYERQTERNAELQKDMIRTALKSLTDRMEKLEKSSSQILSALDNDINRLYLYCSKKIERESKSRRV